jgi:hypothetical protein
VKGSLSRTPNFISASTPKELVRLMLKNNVDKRLEFRYFDIAQAKDGTWYAWYYYEIETVKDIQSLIDNDISTKKDGK